MGFGAAAVPGRMLDGVTVAGGGAGGGVGDCAATVPANTAAESRTRDIFSFMAAILA
jgi:hypothetical protein